MLQRPVGGETTAAAAAGGAGPRTSTPIPTAVPSTSSRGPKPSQPTAKRELFHSLFLRYSMSKNVVTLKSGSEVTQGH